MNGRRVVTRTTIVLGFLAWLVLSQYLIDDLLSLVVAVAIGLAGPLAYQAYDAVRRRDSGTPRNRF